MAGGQFPILGNGAYDMYVGPLTHKGGANQTTHIATIRYPVQAAPITSVVKLMPADGLYACNEALAWLFLRALGVQAPRHAALISMTEAKAVRVLGRKLVTKGYVSDKHVLAWATQQLDFKSIQVLFAGSQADLQWLALLQTVEGAAIAAFDEAFLNVDRNFGNVLYINAHSCIAVDHEMCFGIQNWVAADLIHLDMDGDSMRAVKRARATKKLSQHELSIILNGIVFHAQKHSATLKACEDHMTRFIAGVHPQNAQQLTARVLSFITERTALHWMEERLGVV